MSRVLSFEERVILSHSDKFTDRLKIAVRDSADWWSINDGSTMTATLTDRMTWAKNRQIGAAVKEADAYINIGRDLNVQALKVCKDMSFDLDQVQLAQGQTILTEDQIVTGLSYDNYRSIADKLLLYWGDKIMM